jgi:two-component system, NtrC family, sensor histidine kinase AtoS
MEQSETSEPSAEALDFAKVVRNCLSCAVLAVDSRGLICGFSPEAERMTNLRATEVVGQAIQVLPTPLKELIDETFAANSAILDREITSTADDGVSLTLRASSTPCTGPGCQPVGVVVVMNEMAAAHQLGLNMQRLDRLASIGTLSASMAHEIKNALVAINTFIEDLIQRNKDSELAGLVHRELRRIDSIVSQMLKFAGPAKPTFARLSVHRVLDQSLRLIQPQIEAKQIRLRRSFGARPEIGGGDDYQLEQAFLNVLLNGIAAMEPHGQLSVSTERIDATAPNERSGAEPSEPLVQVTITDTGEGIPAEHLVRLFEPFFTTKPHGTGLGLAITRRIILEHHGTISVESEVGKGTTFRIALPLAT